jgi:hypothetical protein
MFGIPAKKSRERLDNGLLIDVPGMPQIGRFLQTDPVGYEDGMNWYQYCGNNPVGSTDPWGSEAERKLPPGYYRELQMPTGNVLILPYRLDPSMIQNMADFELYMKAVEKVFDRAPDLPINEIISKELEVLEQSADMTVALAAKDRSAWRVFIEVETVILTADKDGNPNKPKRVNQRWVEVNHLDGWDEEVEVYRQGGYSTWESAVAAAQTGVRFYPKYANEGARPPNEWFHDDVQHQMYGPTEHHYYGPSSKLWDLFDKKTGKPITPPAQS